MSSIKELVQNLLVAPPSDPAVKSVSLRLAAWDFAYASVLADRLGQNPSRFMAMLLAQAIEDASNEYLRVLDNQDHVEDFMREISEIASKIEAQHSMAKRIMRENGLDNDGGV